MYRAGARILPQLLRVLSLAHRVLPSPCLPHKPRTPLLLLAQLPALAILTAVDCG